jgi:N-acetylmuramoyl-L-alanine amidase
MLRSLVLRLAVLAGLAAPIPAALSPAWAEAAAAVTVRATDARVAGDERRTRLIVDLTGSVTQTSFILADPNRVVIDLPEVDFALPAAAGHAGRGLVSAYRFGLIAPGKSRIVLDLTEPATIDKAFVLDPADGQPARLVIDLVKATRPQMLAAIAAQQKPLAEAEPAGKPAGGQAGLPVIVIDPGHGGIDSGAVSPKGEAEKAIVLGFAKTLAAKLTETGHYKAVLTRDDDSFVSLSGRIDVARANNAALFISIHADTLPDPFGVRGATIYTLSDTASDAESARYAEKENRADLIAGVDLSAEPDDVADILIDLTRRETKSFSNQFAKLLTDAFKEAATLNKNPRRFAGFKVLKAPDVPSVLLELGYLSNRQDAALLTSEDWRAKAATAVTGAIDGFFTSRARDARATSN